MKPLPTLPSLAMRTPTPRAYGDNETIEGGDTFDEESDELTDDDSQLTPYHSSTAVEETVLEIGAIKIRQGFLKKSFPKTSPHVTFVALGPLCSPSPYAERVPNGVISQRMGDTGAGYVHRRIQLKNSAQTLTFWVPFHIDLFLTYIHLM